MSSNYREKRLILPGIPCAQARMRYFSRGKFGQIYDPSGAAKKIIRSEIQKQFNGQKLFEHPHISFEFYMPIPSSLCKKQRIALSDGQHRHEKKPDVDNMIKLYLDCLDNICFLGDQKVSLGRAIKLYSPAPMTVITITEYDELFEKSSSSETVCLRGSCALDPSDDGRSEHMNTPPNVDHG